MQDEKKTHNNGFIRGDRPLDREGLLMGCKSYHDALAASRTETAIQAGILASAVTDLMHGLSLWDKALQPLNDHGKQMITAVVYLQAIHMILHWLDHTIEAIGVNGEMDDFVAMRARFEELFGIKINFSPTAERLIAHGFTGDVGDLSDMEALWKKVMGDGPEVMAALTISKTSNIL